jgi:hypothetical protein
LSKPYNPLEKANLAASIVRAILDSPVHPLSNTGHLTGAGVYVIYYTGKLKCYAPLAKANSDGQFSQPIYIGKAIPKGGRKGGLTEDAAAKGTALRDRLNQHLASVSEASNLDAGDFYFKSLVVDDIWIPLGENILIEQYKPVWNRVVDGFGNKDPGQRRAAQHGSPWDVLHPGRKFAVKLGFNPRLAQEITDDLKTYFETGSMPKRRKSVIESDPVEDEAE